MTKVCSKCSQSKSMDDFYDHKTNKDGKDGACKECKRSANRDRQRKAYASDPEYRQRRLSQARRQNLGTRHAQRFERGDAWVSNYTSRCEKIGVTPAVSQFSWQDVVDEYGNQCFYCHHGAFEELDHFTPVAHGGSHSLGNVRPSCEECNRAKMDSDPLEFASRSMAVDDADEADAISALEFACLMGDEDLTLDMIRDRQPLPV